MTNYKTLFVAALFFLSSPEAFSDIELLDYQYVGTGCPVNSSMAVLEKNNINSKHKDKIEISFKQMLVESGWDIPERGTSKQCEISFILQYPSGLKPQLETMWSGGYVKIGKSTQGRIVTWIDVGENNKSVKYEFILMENFSGDFDHKSTSSQLEKVKTPCGGKVKFKLFTKLKIVGDTDKVSSIITINRKKKKASQGIKLKWQECDTNAI